MIVRISKVELAGPRELLYETVSLLREMGTLQIDPDAVRFIKEKDDVPLESYVSSRDSMTERFFYEDLKGRIDELLSYLPRLPKRRSRIEPRALLESIHETLQQHLPLCREMHGRRESLQQELRELKRYGGVLDAVEPLVKEIRKTPDVDFIGVTLLDENAKKLLRETLTLKAEGKFELVTSKAEDGTIAGIIAIGRDISGEMKEILRDKDIPELRFPPSFGDMSFIEKIGYLRIKTTEVLESIEEINMRFDSLYMKWGGIYMMVKEWLEEKLSLLKVSASVYETKMCFFLYGWIASADVDNIKTKLEDRFSGKVVLEEMEIREEDMHRIPVILKNPHYFQPFELLTRILPLPRYTSYDPTPFIAVFFPLFFGMILGDAGYGLLLMSTAAVIVIRYSGRNRNLTDAAKILFIGSCYTFLFGIIYGEFFGELGHRIFGLTPLLIDRRTAVVPMIYFAVTVGVTHVLLGSFLAFLAALREKTSRRALYQILQILIIICILTLVATITGKFPSLSARPLIIVIVIITPLLLLTGGLLAPLEVIKSIGNIISYTRIMAIGLTSVLLAYVANRFAGMTGDIVVGIIAAGLIHLLNIIIGVFSPTIHSLRLHYVEFFSKFIEPGGRKFEPLKKER